MAHCHGSHLRVNERRAVRWTLFLKIVVLIIQVFCVFLSLSLALSADSAHLFLDIVANIVVLLALWWGERTQLAERQKSIEAWGSVSVGVLLMIAGAWVLVHAYERFQHEPEILSVPLFVAALIGFVVNLVNVFILSHYGHLHLLDDLRTHEIMDCTSSAAVVICAIVLFFGPFYWFDTAVSLGVGLLIIGRGLILCYRTLKRMYGAS